MRLYVTLCVVIIGVYAADIQKPVPIWNHNCYQPREISIPELVEVRHSGVYPTTAIRKAIGKLASTKKLQLKKAIALGNSCCERYRIRSPDVKPVAKSVSIKPINFWIDTCPSYTKYYYFPRAIMYNKQTCWVLPTWHNLRCKRTACRNKRCSGVYAFYPWITACRHTTYKTHVYYIWCPRYGLVRRYVRLPQCCSCMKLHCLPWFQPMQSSA